MNFIKCLSLSLSFFILTLFLLHLKGFELFPKILDRVQEISGNIDQQSSLNIEQLQSASLVKEFIFPYDFIPTSEVNWPLLNLKVANNVALSDEETTLHRFYLNVLACGFDLSRYPNSFFVISAKSSAGINLQGKSWFKIDSSDRKKVTINLPPPQIVTFDIINRLSTKGHWPDVTITPTAWANLIAFLKEMMLDDFKASNLLEEASSNSIKLVNQTFRAAGFSTIVFNNLSSSFYEEIND